MSKKTYSPYGIISERLKELYIELDKISIDKQLLLQLNSCISLSEGVESYLRGGRRDHPAARDLHRYSAN